MKWETGRNVLHEVAFSLNFFSPPSFFLTPDNQFLDHAAKRSALSCVCNGFHTLLEKFFWNSVVATLCKLCCP